MPVQRPRPSFIDKLHLKVMRTTEKQGARVRMVYLCLYRASPSSVCSMHVGCIILIISFFLLPVFSTIYVDRLAVPARSLVMAETLWPPA